MSDEVLRLARAGCTYPEIARRTGFTVRRAGEIARGAGISRKPRRNRAWWEFSDKTRARAVAMYVGGSSVAAIEAKTMASSTSIRNWLRLADVEVRRAAGAFDGDQIRALRAEGFSIREVAGIVGCAGATVWHHCKDS